jgi:hypothetical protein
MGMKIMKYDDSIMSALDANATKDHLADKSNWGTIKFTEKLDPGNSNVVPFITGHKYRFHFGVTGINFENMNVEFNENWDQSDKHIYLVHNFSDVRAAINATVEGTGQIMNDTIP